MHLFPNLHLAIVYNKNELLDIIIDENNEKLLDALKDVPDEKRTAYFICVAAYVRPDGFEVIEEGRFYGRILHQVVGSGGFGYDPLFAPNGMNCSSAELSAQEKDAISHRGKAMRAIAPHIIG